MLRFLFVPRYPKLKITPLVLAPQLPLDGITSGIFPYLSGSVSVDLLRSVVMAYEVVIVPGRQGAKVAAKAPGVLIDPAVYAPQGGTEPDTLFDYDDWLMRQKAAGRASSPCSLVSGDWMCCAAMTACAAVTAC